MGNSLTKDKKGENIKLSAAQEHPQNKTHAIGQRLTNKAEESPGKSLNLYDILDLEYVTDYNEELSG